MITVEQAGQIIQSQTRDFGVEEVFYENSLQRVLAETLFADRDLPPFNRATVDGIALHFEDYKNGLRSFKIKATQAAGEIPVAIDARGACVELMTGAALDESVDTVIRYEDLDLSDGSATIKDVEVKRSQNIHFRGKDKKQYDKMAGAGEVISPALIGLAASIGKTRLQVKKLPRVAILSTGDEMVPPHTVPTAFQLRRSNGVTLKAVLESYRIDAEVFHLNDDSALIESVLSRCLDAYDVLLMSGGVSMGKFDYVPQVLEGLGVVQLFHKIKQRPGKPFWFGARDGRQLVFAFPGNPVSVWMCLHRYFIPWLEASLEIRSRAPEYAVLQNDIYFPHSLQFFVQVKLEMNDRGMLTALAAETNGSGDFSNLVYTDAFMELPLEKNEFKKGEVYPVWRYR
ncbi:molybdopterin molybdotransferase MoeA [Niabella pedocola]|uniref:Molybdopterin molybdenumtransferase n=1 Tax=Niabella pedocola TaxID=1752077 RepID=A0ABS8PK00_9BACT|nr:molybdopterin molybdotransferase MoeA [Niabella pedocola]MCD2421404.1 molybdopterin molybdotransferase MoeA [Niabella pedocola]